MIEGIDVSAWQGEIDWNKAYQAGARFAIIRAGSVNNETGVCWEDNYFRRNALMASALMPVSFYWFFRPNHSATRQAEYFSGLLDLVRDKISIAHVWCDIEVAGQAAVVKAFCELVNACYPIGIYTNPNTALYLLTGDKTWMKNYPLWLADWSAPANVPAPWTEYKIWQYAVKQDGAAYGMKSAGLDHDQMVDGYLPPTPPPPPVDDHTEILAQIAILNSRINSLEAAQQVNQTTLYNHEERLDNLEQAPAPPGDLAVYQVTKVEGNTNSFKVTGADGAGKPIMAIREPRVQWQAGDRILVKKAYVVATGGERFYEIAQVIAGVTEKLYLRAVDGGIVG